MAYCKIETFDILDEFAKMDILNLKDKKRDILNFQSLYLNRMNKISLSFWILDLLKLRYLVLQIRDILSLKENQDP
ncbi:MAG: hypothetical protein ACE5J9_07145 [Methanosarcinales archaeon]